MKEESRLEPPVEIGTFLTQGARTDIVTFRDAIQGGKRKRDLVESHPLMLAKHAKFYDLVTSLNRPARKDRQVLLITGPTGAGKTRMVYDQWKDEDWYEVPLDENIWFDGYDSHTHVLIDDFVGQYKLVLLLRLLHAYPERVPVKYGYVWWNPEKIIITSNFEPRKWYRNWEDREPHYHALMRRITHWIELDEDGEQTIHKGPVISEDSSQ